MERRKSVQGQCYCDIESPKEVSVAGCHKCHGPLYESDITEVESHICLSLNVFVCRACHVVTKVEQSMKLTEVVGW